MRSIASVIEEQLRRLADAAGLGASRRSELFQVLRRLGSDSLARSVAECYGGLSRINANGLPWQWSFTLGGDRGVRFLCESGTPGSPGPARARACLRSLEGLCAELGWRYPHWLGDQVADILLPSPGHWPKGWHSAIWFAAGASRGGVGLKVYFNLNRDSALERWRRAGRVLQGLGRTRALERLCELSGQVSHAAWPVGLAVDIGPGETPGRIKIYFRSAEAGPGWVRNWVAAFGLDEWPWRCLLDCFPFERDRPYPEGAFVSSLEVHQDERFSLKIDLAMTRWLRDEAAIIRGIRHLGCRLGLDESGYLRGIEVLGIPSSTSSCLHRFVGLGTEPDGAMHINVYVEPPVAGEARASGRRSGSGASGCQQVGVAARRASEWLSGRQDTDGAWRDYELPVGRADSWVTAWVLMHLGESHVSPGVERAVQPALGFLEAAGGAGGQWGFHEEVSADADSTALALLALQAWGRAAGCNFDGLRSFMRPDGGIATFRSGGVESGAWLESCVDVTPHGCLALRKAERSRERCARARRYLRATQREDGLWSSYWWTSDLYPTWAAFRLFGAGDMPRSVALRETLTGYRPRCCFEQALLVWLLAGIGELHSAGRHVASLLAGQRADGGWVGSGWLRLAYPEVKRPGQRIASGPLYRDVEGIFTTALVVGAFGVYREMAGIVPEPARALTGLRSVG